MLTLAGSRASQPGKVRARPASGSTSSTSSATSDLPGEAACFTPAMCEHLHDTMSRYDAAAQILTLLLVCRTCGTERVVETIKYEPKPQWPTPWATGPLAVVPAGSSTNGRPDPRESMRPRSTRRARSRPRPWRHTDQSATGASPSHRPAALAVTEYALACAARHDPEDRALCRAGSAPSPA
jgi:hypothetical protein